MSLNLTIHAEKLPTETEVEELQEKFDCWQTPTEVTFKILDGKDKIASYKEWVLGEEVAFSGEEHCKRLDLWIKLMTEKGYKIVVSYT